MKTKKRSKILSLLLVLMMLLTMVPITAVTANAADDTSYPQAEIRNYYTFATYLRSYDSRDLKLMEDIDYTVGINDLSIDVRRNQKLDLNGHKITIDASRRAGFVNLLCIRRGEFTLYDSKGGGELAVSFPNDDKAYSIIMMSSEKKDEPAKFTMNGGTLTKLHPNMTYTYGASGCIGDDYFNKPENGKRSQITINGGTINCPYEWDRSQSLLDFEVEAMPLALQLLYSNLTINGGTFNGIVWTDTLWRGEQDTEPRVVLNGGEFNSPFVVEGMQKDATQIVIDGAHFKDGFHVNNGYSINTDVGTVPVLLLKSGVFDSPDKNPKLDIYNVTANSYGNGVNSDATARARLEMILHAMKCFPNSAIKVNGKFYTSENIESLVGKNNDDFYLKLNSSTPIEVIRDAWGVMESVTLDGKKINYAKDWKGAVEEMDNSTAHTIKFKWKPLASELVNAGYTYRTTCEHYISGSTAVQQTDTIAADKTSHTVTIPAGAEPKVYSFDLKLNLEKNGNLVGIVHNQHIVKLVVDEAPPVLDTFISTVSFNLDKTDIGEPGKLSFTATDVNGKPVAIHPDVTWKPDKIVEGNNNHVSFTIPAPKGYTFSGKDGKTTTLKFGGVDVIGYIDSTGALNYSFPLDVVHRHKADHVSYNAKYHWKACSCNQKIMNTSEKHTMSDWVKGDTLLSGGVVYNRSCTSGCGYTETTIDYNNVKHVTSLVLNIENYPMDGMSPHNFVKNGRETPKDSDGEYLLTVRNSNIPYPSFSITSGNDKAKLYAMNPESYTVRADNPDFAMWSRNGSRLAPVCDDKTHDTHNDKSTFTTGVNYGVRLFLEAEDGYAFYKDFNEDNNFKLFTDMDGIEVKNYIVEKWYYYSKRPSYDDDKVPEGWGWYTQAPDDDSAGASKVGVLFQLTARNEGELNITLPELKAGDDLKTTWADFEGIGAGNFVKDCYGSETMAWWGGPSCVIHNSAVTGESVSVIAQAGQTYRLTIPAVNEYVLAHTTIKNPTAATRIDESPDGAITVTYKLPAAADDKTVNGAAVSITPPAYGAAPSTVATVADTAHYTASPVTWNPADAAFEAKEYTATVTLTPKTDYTFADNAVFTINGYKATVTKNTDGSVALSYAFKAAAPASENPFTDVPSGAYYEDPVIWAVKKDITSGTSATTFKPDGSCTRAQAVTFLWRAAGSPEPKSAAMPFTDVPAGSYFEKAVLWAVENGITKGTSDTTFGPDASCTRAQIVTFQWRSQKSPAAGTDNPFTDVKASAYYADAVLWAVKEDVTKGTTSTTFSPDANCTRAQIVTFIWRALAE